MYEILQALLSADNTIRGHAEAHFDSSLRASPDTFLLELARTCALTTADNSIRGLAIILLRRVLSREPELWMDVVSEEARQKVRWELLTLLDSPEFTDNSMRKKLCDSISIVAMMTFEGDQDWPELFPHMFRAVTNQQSTWVQKENALNLFTNLADYVRSKYQKEFAKIAMLLNNLASQNEPNLDVRLAAVRAGWCLVAVCNQDTDGEIVTPFKPLVSTSLSVITAVILADHPKCAEPIEDLIDLAGSIHSRLLMKKDIEQGIQMMLELAQVRKNKNSARSNLRILALEFIVTLMETRGAAVRKIKPPENAVVLALFPILIGMMMELPNLKEPELRLWGNRYPANACTATASQHVDDEDDCDEMGIDFEAFGASLEYVDRIARAMKPKHVLPVVFNKAAELIQQRDADWKFAHSALLMLAHIVEFIDRKEPELGELCRTAANYATDHPHMRVRHAGHTLLARLSYDCAPEVHQRHAQTIVGAYMRGIADQVPRVQAHAAIGLINFCSACQDYEEFETALKPYLSEVVNRLFQVLQNSPQIVQENVISALSSVAKTAGEDFRPYYSSLPILKSALANLHSPTQYPLKARIIDCMSVIGQSCGREMFSQDAIWLLQLLEQIPLTGEDQNVQHIQAAWMVLGQVMGPEIGPFLAKIVPFTLEMASKAIDDEDDDDIEADENITPEEEAALAMVRTAAVDDRLLALEMLCSFASHTKQAYFPFLEPTMNIFFRDIRLENCANDDVRSRVAEGFPDMIRCALGCMESRVLPTESFGRILSQSLEVLCVASNSEDSIDTLKLIVRSLMDILSLIHDLVVSSGHDACPDYVEPCCAVLIQLLKDSVQRRALEYATLKCDTAEDEMDEEAQEDYEDKVQAEHDLHFLLTGAVGALIRANPNSFVPSAFASDTVGPQVFDFAHHVRLCHDQKIAIFILDDVIENCALSTLTPELISKISNQLITAVKTTKSSSPTESTSEVASLVQAAAYGLGICGERFGNHWESASVAAKHLLKIVQSTPKDLRFSDSSYGNCLDNCASALMKIARACPQALSQGGVSPDILFEAWLSYFPLQADVQESCLNSFALMKMVQEERIPYLLDPNLGLPLVIRAFANVIGTEYLGEAHVDRAVGLLEELKSQVGDETFANAIRAVPQEQLQQLEVRLHKHS